VESGPHFWLVTESRTASPEMRSLALFKVWQSRLVFLSCRTQNTSRVRQTEAPSMIRPHTVLALSRARQTETLSMTGGLASSWLPHLVQEGKLEWVSPSCRTENTSRAHA
jgi:hypothetical protein